MWISCHYVQTIIIENKTFFLFFNLLWNVIEKSKSEFVMLLRNSYMQFEWIFFFIDRTLFQVLYRFSRPCMTWPLNEFLDYTAVFRLSITTYFILTLYIVSFSYWFCIVSFMLTLIIIQYSVHNTLNLQFPLLSPVLGFQNRLCIEVPKLTDICISRKTWILLADLC